jgi:muramoyltetrapeptide carboxypeptidase
VAPNDVIVPGKARGPIAGGNLTLLASLCGTPFQPDLRGKVLFIEEAGEEAYRVDRLLTQLHLAGSLAGVAAVLLGAILVPPRRRFPPDRDLNEILAGRAEVDCARGRLRFSP